MPPTNNASHVIPLDDNISVLPTTTAAPAKKQPNHMPRHRYPLRSSLQSYHTTKCEKNTVVNKASEEMLEYQHLIKGPDKDVWIRGLASNLGHLAQCVDSWMPKGTNTIFFIDISDIPRNCQISYVLLVTSLQPYKTEVHQVQVTVGGDRLYYEGIFSTDTASMTTTTILLNSVVSTPSARFMTLDIYNFYYGTKLNLYKYLCMALAGIQQKL